MNKLTLNTEALMVSSFETSLPCADLDFSLTTSGDDIERMEAAR
ncbi:MAG TPA: hypothetical protein VGC13_27745 [Longimicrobium sp.]|jgi:hypothetical protein